MGRTRLGRFQMHDAEQGREAYKRFMDMDLSALQELWAKGGRTDWAEAALRDALIDQGVLAEDLDAVVSRRDDIAADSPPKVRETLWNYGFVGRLTTLVGGIAIGRLIYMLLGYGAMVISVTLVLGSYIAVLYRRQHLHRGQPMSKAARFWINWQYVESIIITVLVIFILILASMQ